MAEAWIIDAVRTPRGKGRKATPDKPGGALAETHPQALAATCLKALAQRNSFDPGEVDDVVLGVVNQANSEQADGFTSKLKANPAITLVEGSMADIEASIDNRNLAVALI